MAPREEKQILLPQGGIRMTCPAAAGAERSVEKNLLLLRPCRAVMLTYQKSACGLTSALP
jgi:hypothetical protein